VVNKKKLKFELKRLQDIKTWQLVILFILSVFVAATFLRLNNIGMVERRTAVMTADTAGDDTVTQNRLYDLQRYVTSHMNTSMGKGVYLESSYKRDVEIAYTEASKDSNPNGNIYKTVQEVCAPKFTTWSYAYIKCSTDELAKYPASSNLVSSVNLPKAETYLHVFASPLWSSDFAGWSVVVSGVILIMIILRFIGVIILRMLLKYRYKNI